MDRFKMYFICRNYCNHEILAHKKYLRSSRLKSVSWLFSETMWSLYHLTLADGVDSGAIETHNS